jgi:Family of unknown function (DUF6171)
MSDNWEHDNPHPVELSSLFEERKIRISLCKECDELTQFNKCSKCNCFMPIKTWLKSSKCPLEKW